jgi:nitroreductase
MTLLGKVMRTRHSERVSFDPGRAPSDSDLREILEAARWAPTAHNMQNFEVIVVDDQATLAAIGRVRSGVSAEFIRENYAQLSFSEEELIAKGTGLLASMFPPSWRSPDAEPEDAVDLEHGFLDATMRSCPVVLIVVYDHPPARPRIGRRLPGHHEFGLCAAEHLADGRGAGPRVVSHERLQRRACRGRAATDPVHPRAPEDRFRLPDRLPCRGPGPLPARSPGNPAVRAPQLLRSATRLSHRLRLAQVHLRYTAVTTSTRKNGG